MSRHANTSPPDSADLSADAGSGEDQAPEPVEAPFRQSAAATMAARWQDPAYRERASGNNRDDRVYGLRHVASGVEVRRTKQEMREEYGLKHDGLDAVVAGRTFTTRGWALIPKPRMPEGPRWCFP